MRGSFISLLALTGLLLVSSFDSIAQPVFNIQNKKDACDGIANGSFEILVTSGTGPIDAFVFSAGPAIGPLALTVNVPFLVSNLAGGPGPGGRVYTIIVTDANGNDIQGTSIINVTPDLSASLASSNNNTDCSSPNGAIDTNVSGGTGSYTFQWTGPVGFLDPGTEDLSLLTGGSYTLTVIDNGTNCTRIVGPVVLTDPLPAAFAVSTSTPSICLGDGGTINLSDSEVGVSYEIFKDAAPTGITLPGTNNPLVFAIAPGLLTPAGSYVFTIVATQGVCPTVLMTGNGTIVVNDNPTISTPSIASVCVGTTTSNLSYAGTTGTPDQYRIDWDAAAEGAGMIDVPIGVLPASPIPITGIPVAAGTYNGTLYVINSATTCESAGDPINVTVVDLPTITLGTNPSVCIGITSSTISYSATSGAPDEYRIDWDAAAEAAGMVDVGLGVLPASPIPINGIPVVAGTYNGNLFVRNSLNGCESLANVISVTVDPLPTITLNANPTVCSGVINTTIGYSTTTGSPDEYRIDWDAAAEAAGLIDVALGALPLTPIPLGNVPVAPGTYNGQLFVSNNGTGCESVANPISITVLALPTITPDTNPSVCIGTTNTTLGYLSVTGAPDQYRIDWDAAAEGAGMIDVPIGVLPASPIPITGIPVAAGTYNGILFVSELSTGCESSGVAINVTVVDLPTITLGTNPSVCIGITSSTISYSATSGAPDEYRIDWDAAAEAAGMVDVGLGVLPASPIPINGIPVVAGTYNGNLFVRNSLNGCESLANVISVTVDPLPTITLNANPTVCSGVINTTIGYSTTTGSPDEYRIDWDAAAEAAGLIDVALGALPLTPIPLGIVPVAPGTYNGQLFVSNNGTGCESVANPISITVLALPTITPDTNPSVCIGTTNTTLGYLSVTGAPDQYRIDWDAAAEGAGMIDVPIGVLPASPIPITGIPVAAGTYNGILFVSELSTGCESTGVPISVDVVGLPTITLGPNPLACEGDATSSLTYSATTNSPDQFRIDWDAAAEAAGLIDVIATALAPSPIIINNVPAALGTYNGTLYVINSSLVCESLGDPISLTVSELPVATLGANPVVCSGVTSSPITYVVTTGTPDQYRIDWDASAEAAGLADVPPGALPPSPISINNIPLAGGVYNGNLFFINSSTTCESLPNPISVTVQQVTAVISGNSNSCAGSSASISVSFTGPGPTWDFVYSDGFSTFNLTANSNPFSFTVNPIISTTYSLVSVVDATCGAGTVSGSATVTVIPIAGNPSTFGADTWIGYVYDDSGNPAPPATNIDYNISKYRGFINETEIASLSPFSSYDVATDQFNFNLTNVIPASGPNVCGSYLDDFSVRFRMTKSFAAGIYTFTVGSDDGVRLLVDGVNVLPAAAFDTHAFTTYTSAPQCLTAGNHDLVIEYFDRGGFARVNFAYSSTGAPSVVSPVSLCVNSAPPILTASSAGATDFNWYTDAGLTNLVFSGANYTPAGTELDMMVAGQTDFFVTAVYACGETPAAQITVDVTNGANIVLPAPPVQVCDVGGIVDLTTLVSATPLGGVFTFSGTGVIGTGPNFDPSLVGGPSTTVTVDYVSGTCAANTSFNIDIVSNATSNVPIAAVTACEPAGIVDLTTLVSATPAGGAFVFSGTGVTGSDFDPTGLTGVTTITVDYTVGGCVAPTQTFDMNVVPNISLVVDNSTIVCPSSGVIDLTTLVTPNPAGGTFTFSGTGVTGSSFDPALAAGSTVIIDVDYDLTGCLASTTLQIVVRSATDLLCGGPLGNCNTVVITPVPSPAICSPTDGSIQFNINPATPQINNTGVRIDILGVSASNAGISRTNFNDPLFTALPVGTYDFTIEYGDPACIKTGQVTVLLGPDVVDFDVAANSVNCFGSSGGVVLSNINGASTADYTYEVVQLGNIVASGAITQLESLTDVTLTGFGLGDFEVKLSQDQSATTSCTNPVQSAFKPFTVTGATASLDTLYVTKTISVPDLPSGSIIVGIAESLQEPYEVRLELTQPLFPGQVFAQDFTEAARNPLNLKMELAVPNLFAGGYLLTLRDALGCQKDYQITINVDTNLMIPNVFTPNGDGVNEVFFIRNMPDATEVIISNRWGKQVYASNNYQNDWDGGDTSDGVYYYRINAAGQSYSGWVEIMRNQ